MCEGGECESTVVGSYACARNKRWGLRFNLSLLLCKKALPKGGPGGGEGSERFTDSLIH